MSDNAAMSAAISRMEAQAERAVVRQIKAQARSYRRSKDLHNATGVAWVEFDTMDRVFIDDATSEQIERRLRQQLRALCQEVNFSTTNAMKLRAALLAERWHRLTARARRRDAA